MMTWRMLECYASNMQFNIATYTTDRGEKEVCREGQREEERFGENR